MNKYFKGALIFVTGAITGFSLCGGIIAKKTIESDDLLFLIKTKISKRIYNLIYGDSSCKNYDAGSIHYYNYYDKEIVFESRMEADKVLDNMRDILKKYGVVTVADFYYLCDITGNYIDNMYGWVDLKNVKLVRIRAGYKLSLPTAKKL